MKSLLYTFLLLSILLMSGCNMALRYFNIKTDKERINVEFYVVGIPLADNNGPRDRYIMDQKKYLDLLKKTCDSLNINQTTSILVDSSEAKINLSIDDFKTANALMAVFRKNGLSQFNANFIRNENRYQIILNVKSSIFPRYKVDWIKRSDVNIQNSNYNATFFPNESTDCLEVDQKSANKIGYSVLNCNRNEASPIQKITVLYEGELIEKNNKPHEYFSEHAITFICIILGGIVSLATLIGYMKRK